MFAAASSAYRASLSETLASRGGGGGNGNGGGSGAPPPNPPIAAGPPLRRPLSTAQQQLLRQRRRHTLSGGGGGRSNSNNNSLSLTALLADACQSATFLTGMLLLGAAIVAFSLRGLYGAPTPARGAGAAAALAPGSTSLVDGRHTTNLLVTPAAQPLPIISSSDPHAPALPPGTTVTTGEATEGRGRRRQAGGAPDRQHEGDGAAPAPPPVPLDDALYAEAHAAAFPVLPFSEDDGSREEEEGQAPLRAQNSRRRERQRQLQQQHHRQRRLALARLAEGLPPAAAAVSADAYAEEVVAGAAPPLLSAAVAYRAITGGRKRGTSSAAVADGASSALPPRSAVAVATFVSSEAQLEFALNWAAGLDAAGVDGDDGEDDAEEDEEDSAEAPPPTGYLAVAATPELAARLADAGVPSAVFPTPVQARAARAEWEAAAARLLRGKKTRSKNGQNGEGEGEQEEEAAATTTSLADVPTPLVSAEAAARGHPRVALARALLEFGFSSALVTDPDVAWAAGTTSKGTEEAKKQQQQSNGDPRAYLAAAARRAKVDALVGSNALSPGAGRAGLLDLGLDVPTALILGSSGVAELVQGGGGGGGGGAAGGGGGAAAPAGAAATAPPPPPRGHLLNRNQTNAAASAAFGASRRLTDGLLDPGVLYLRRTPAAIAFADAWCSVMAGWGEDGGRGGGGSSGGGGSDQQPLPAPPPPPPVDSHAFNRLALEGWEPRFVPAPGTWSALNATTGDQDDEGGEQQQQPALVPAAAAAAVVASPLVPARERALVGWRGDLRLGVLPLASFPNGHAHFVQRVNDLAADAAAANNGNNNNPNPQNHDPQPPPPLVAVRPGTHLFGGLSGKRHRLRDAGLWRLDGPEYFFGWDARDLLAADERARERAAIRREKEGAERAAERVRARDATAARASALAVAAGAGKGMGAGELAAKFFRPFSSGASSWGPSATMMAKKRALNDGGGKAADNDNDDEQNGNKKYVAFALPLAPDLPAAEFEALPGGAEEMAHYHAAGLALQREQLMAMVGVALALGRGLILPPFRCYCDRHWTMLHRCRIPGAGGTPLPFACPQDHVAEPGKFSESGLLGEATPLEVREASFLARVRPAGSAAPRVLEVEPTEGADAAPREEHGVVDAATGACVARVAAAAEGGQRCLRRLFLPLDTAQGVLRAHLAPYERAYDVLLFSTPLRVLRSFDSPEAAAAAARRIAHLRGSDAGAGLPASAASAAARRRRRRAAIAAATKAAKEEGEEGRRENRGGGDEAGAAKAAAAARA